MKRDQSQPQSLAEVAAAGAADPEVWELRLYVAGKTPKSVAAFPNSTQLVMLMRAAGLTNTHVTMLGFGTVAIHSGVKTGQGQ